MDTKGVLPIKYFGFSSYTLDNTLATFFYNCKNDSIFEKGKVNRQSVQAKNEMSSVASVDLRNCTCCSYLSTVNLLVLILKSNSFFIYFHGISDDVHRTVLVTKCRFYTIKDASSDYDYKGYIKISDIKNSQPDGYILRLVLFIQGARDANILLTTSNQPNFDRDFVYEISESHINFHFSHYVLHLTQNI